MERTPNMLSTAQGAPYQYVVSAGHGERFCVKDLKIGRKRADSTDRRVDSVSSGCVGEETTGFNTGSRAAARRCGRCLPLPSAQGGCGLLPLNQTVHT